MEIHTVLDMHRANLKYISPAGVESVGELFCPRQTTTNTTTAKMLITTRRNITFINYEQILCEKKFGKFVKLSFFVTVIEDSKRLKEVSNFFFFFFATRKLLSCSIFSFTLTTLFLPVLLFFSIIFVNQIEISSCEFITKQSMLNIEEWNILGFLYCVKDMSV